VMRGDGEPPAEDHRLRLRTGALRALAVLDACPMLPVDAFAPMVGLASGSGAYQQLARLRSRGLAEVRREDLGFVVGAHRRGLWSITELGSRVLRDATPLGKRDRPDKEVRPRKRLLNRHLPLRVACYRLLAWFLVEERAQGHVLATRGWDWSSGSEFRLTEQDDSVRVRLPAAAHVSSPDGTHPTLSSSRRVLLLPDLGTAPVARYGELLRRVIAQSEPVTAQMAGCDALLVGTPDPDGRGTRVDAWRSLLERVARREQASAPPVRVVSWARVSAWLGGSGASATGAGDQARARPTTVAQSGREQVLHLLGSSASGVKRLGSHLVRHTFAQTMARKGAPIADIQDVLGHTSDKMARHYAGEARKAAAAELMAKHSLAS
jgi:integrase-like protein